MTPEERKTLLRNVRLARAALHEAWEQAEAGRMTRSVRDALLVARNAAARALAVLTNNDHW